MTQRKIQLEQLELSGSSLVLPAGAILPYGGSAAPANFLLCQGQSVSTTTYAELHAVIGYTYGGSGANFNLPNLRGRVPVGQNTFGAFNVALGSFLGTEDVTLNTSQVPNHTHTASGSAVAAGAHTHTVTGSVNSAGNHQHPGSWNSCEGGNGDREIKSWDGGTNWYTGPAGAHTHSLTSATALSNGSHSHTVSITVNSTVGGGGSHTNIQPSIVTQYIISTGV